jgi:hypothetical protein
MAYESMHGHGYIGLEKNNQQAPKVLGTSESQLLSRYLKDSKRRINERQGKDADITRVDMQAIDRAILARQTKILLQERQVRSGDYSARYRVALAWDLPTHLAGELALDGNVSIRVAVARNQNTPPEILCQLCDDSYWGADVRIAVAANPGTPPAVLDKLLNDHDGTVRFMALVSKNNLNEAIY